MKRTAVLLLFVAGFLSACSTIRWVENPIANHKDLKVTLEYQTKGDQVVPQHYDHPCKLNQHVVAAFLKGLDYQDGGFLFKRARKYPIFQESEIARLAPAITAALAKANANQRVAFTSYSRGGEFIFKHRRITKGILFVKPKNELNIAFSLIDYNLNPNREYEVPPELAGRDPLTIRISGTGTRAAPTAPYAKRHVFANGDKSPVWIVANINDLKAAVRAESRPAKPALAVEPASETPPAAGKTVSTPVETPPAGSMQTREEKVEKRLQFLKNLYDKGLINQKEYDRKKSEVLQEIK